MELKGKTALVTGGNAGIGLETVRGLAQKGAAVILMSRSAEKGKAAREDVVRTTGNQDVFVMTCDLASMAEIHVVAKEFLEKFPQLDILVNNAGAFYSEFAKTKDGFERQFAINHLAPFLLTKLLMPALEAAPSARIVNVSSNGHYQGQMHFDDLGLERNYSGLKAYSQSKVCNVLFTRELTKRLQGKPITANSLHPGVVRTEIGNKNSSGFAKIGWILLKPFMITAAQGAETSLFVATSPSLEGVSGKYFVKSKEKWPSRYSQSDELAARLWDISEEMCALRQ